MRLFRIHPVSLFSIGLLLAITGCGGADSSLGRGTGGGGGTTTTSSFAVVADQGANTVPILGIDSNGVLTPVTGSPITQGANPTRVAVAPNGKWIYVANFGTVGELGISSTGAVTFLNNGTAGATLGAPGGIVVDPSGKFVLVANQAAQSVSVFAIDQNTGALPAVATSVTSVNVNATSMAMSGAFLYLAEDNQIDGYTLSTITGVLTPMPGAPFVFTNLSSASTSLVVSPSGAFLYASNSTTGEIHAFTLNGTTGAPITQASGGLSSTDPVSLAINPAGTLMFSANPTNNKVVVYFLNSATGAFTSTFPLTTSLFAPTWVAYDTANNFLLVLHNTNHIAVFKVDTTSGALTPVSGSPFTAGTVPTALAIAKP